MAIKKDELEVFDRYFQTIMAAFIQKGSHKEQDAIARASDLARKMVIQRREILKDFEKTEK